MVQTDSETIYDDDMQSAFDADEIFSVVDADVPVDVDIDEDEIKSVTSAEGGMDVAWKESDTVWLDEGIFASSFRRYFFEKRNASFTDVPEASSRKMKYIFESFMDIKRRR